MFWTLKVRGKYYIQSEYQIQNDENHVYVDHI